MSKILINLNDKILPLRDYCNETGLNFNAVWSYKNRHPNMSYEEIINYYKTRLDTNSDLYKELKIKWNTMTERCNNPRHTYYKYYGGRGIKVCDRWLNFENFYKDMYSSYKEHVKKYGEKDTTLDRININIDYCPKNCRWATRKEQANNKSNNIRLKSGETLKEYCDKNNLKYKVIHFRITHGWTLEEAINTPVTVFKQRVKIILPSGETLSEYCKNKGLKYDTIKRRLDYGWTLENALNKPVRQHK